MSFTLWLSADEEQLLSQVMRAEGTKTKQQAIIAALRDKATNLDESLEITPAREAVFSS